MLCVALYRSEEVCCHGCIPASNQGLLSAVTDSLAHLAALENIRAELEFGHINSTLLRYPTSQPASDCTTLDSNLQSVLPAHYQSVYIHCTSCCKLPSLSQWSHMHMYRHANSTVTIYVVNAIMVIPVYSTTLQ